MPYGLATAGDVLTAANVNLLPRGRVAYQANSTATNSGVSSASADVGPTATFTALANRRYRATVTISRIDSSAANTLVVTFADAASSTISFLGVLTVGAGSSSALSGSVELTPAAGSYTVKVRASANTATAAVFQSGSFASYLLVEDIGGI